MYNNIGANLLVMSNLSDQELSFNPMFLLRFFPGLLEHVVQCIAVMGK